MDFERDLATSRPEDRTLDADDVPRIELGEQVKIALTEDVAAGHQLNPAFAVLEVRERGTPEKALHHQPACNRDRLGSLAVADQRLRLDRGVCRPEPARVGFDAAGSNPFQLAATVADDLWLAL